MLFHSSSPTAHSDDLAQDWYVAICIVIISITTIIIILKMIIMMILIMSILRIILIIIMMIIMIMIMIVIMMILIMLYIYIYIDRYVAKRMTPPFADGRTNNNTQAKRYSTHKQKQVRRRPRQMLKRAWYDLLAEWKSYLDMLFAPIQRSSGSRSRTAVM